MSRLQQALDQIVFARRYSVQMIDSIPVSEWFRLPPAGVSHIAWQVGHLAMAQYRLTLERVRGRRPEDATLISDAFLKLFGRDSVPAADPACYPSPEEIRQVFDNVHQQMLQEAPLLSEAELDQPVLTPHSLVKTKLWAFLWCSHHEMIHVGQIGLLRRQLGQRPLW